MGMLACRTVKCDVTGEVYTEVKPGGGFPGWGQLNGMCIRRDEDGLVVSDPWLCPAVMSIVVAAVTGLVDKHIPLEAPKDGVE